MSGSGHRFSRRFAACSVLALGLLSASPGAALAQDTSTRPAANPEQRAAALIRPATVYLEGTTTGWIRMPDGELFDTAPYQASWTCTGFVVNPDGWVATAGHCVDDVRSMLLDAAFGDIYAANMDWAPEELAAFVDGSFTVEGEKGGSDPTLEIAVLFGEGTSGTRLPANVIEYRPLEQGDVALLKVQRDDLPAALLATDDDVAIGTPVLSVGFPGSTEKVTDPSLEPTNKSGKVSAKKTSGTVPFYETDAALSGGMSGGPTVDLEGRVIGVNSFGPSGESQAFNFIAPSSGLEELLAARGITSQLGPADERYRDALAAYYEGRYTEAIEGFDSVLAMSPEYPGISAIKSDAVRLREQHGDAASSSSSSSSKLPLILGGAAAAVLLIAGLGGFLLMRSRRTPAPAAAAAGFHGAPGSGPVPPTGPAGPVPQPGAPGGFGAPPAGFTPPTAPGGYAPQPQQGAPGYEVPPTAPAPAAQGARFCPSCGTERRGTENFCSNCGQRIG
ncbi:trypsin-like peptidase domain-containing protein [Rhodococcus sp. HM1]|uniref:trypsin-like peptidase domain-containing protein n=1 Tax=Rhodococcus sp. HM1 TaxID=2937759 RepID=UPI00200B086B|nr:trypsin-like peptidase domain-containing protein [Rhodococcus sp. HM1]MCK8674418.1 trypsin-like peptidase domain-containing protein [Rhodococcus sp. HM1]